MSEKRASPRLAGKKSPTKKAKGEDKEKAEESTTTPMETEKPTSTEDATAITTEDSTTTAPTGDAAATTEPLAPAETSPKGKGRGRGKRGAPKKEKEKTDGSPRPLKRQNTMEVTAAEGEAFIRTMNAQSLAKFHAAAAELRTAKKKREPEKEKEKEPEKDEDTGKKKKGKGKKPASEAKPKGRGRKAKAIRGSSPVPAPISSATHRSGPTFNADDKVTEEKKAKVINSFMPAEGVTPTTKIEVVFSFDTTGSMSSILGEVRKNIEETVTRLLADIPNIRIGIIAHGDYCDAPTSYVIKTLDLSSDAKAICTFVRSVGATGGGDSDECYELVLHNSKSLSWSPEALKALVMIGDASPHGVEYPQNTLKLDWRKEAQALASSKVKVYSVQAGGGWGSSSFWKEVAELTNGSFLTLAEFSLITDMFMGVCYREATEAQLAAHPEALGELNEDEVRIQMPDEVSKSGINNEQLLQIHTAIHGGYSNVVVNGTTYLISIGNAGCRFVRI